LTVCLRMESVMKAIWSLKDEDYEANVTKCVMVGDSINILFKLIDDGNKVEGQLSLKATNDEQTVEGSWNYHDKKKQNPLPGGAPLESEEETIKATVTGKLQNFRGKQVQFVGKWDEKVFDPELGVYDFEIDANIS